MKRFDYQDINLIPNKCIVYSRSECDTTVTLGKRSFRMPIIPANMECIINPELAKKLAKENYFYVMHRFMTDDDLLHFINDMNRSRLFVSISIGVNQESYRLINRIINMGLYVDYITVDIAHGHSIKMESMIKFLKTTMEGTFIIAGNISTPKAVIDLERWGADAIKVGIGPGSACTTYPVSGFGSRNCQASTVYECSSISSIPIIADGGIKYPGDITKSLVLGAKMVMAGGMFGGFNDSPGEILQIEDKIYKEFWGSASSQAGKTERIEGKRNLIEYRDKSIIDEYKYLEQCLQSSISYAGGNNLNAFLQVKWQ